MNFHRSRTGRFGLTVSLLALWSWTMGAQPARLSIDRLYRLPWIIGTQPKDFVWSSDSSHLAFLWNNEGTNFYDVWEVDVATGKPLRITSMPQPAIPLDPGSDVAKLEQAGLAENDPGVSSVCWRQGGQALLFTLQGKLYSVKPGQAPVELLSGRRVSEVKPAPAMDSIAFISEGDVWVADFGRSMPRAHRVTALATKDVGVKDFYWSPDGQEIAFIESDETHMPVRGIPDYLGDETKLVPVRRPFPGDPSAYRRLGIVATQASSSVRFIDLGTDLQDLIFEVAWSPDSSTVLVDKSDLYIKHRRMLLVNAKDGQASTLYAEDDPKNVTAEWWSAWSPDGRGVYFISDRDNDYHLYFKLRTGGEPKRLTAGNWAVFSAELVTGANAIFFTSNEGRHEERQLSKLSLDSVSLQRITTAPGTHTGFASPDGRFAADAFSDDLTPPDLYLKRLDADSPEMQVTHSPLPEFKAYHWVKASYVTFQNVNDGTELHARLTLPPDFDRTKKYPAILGSVYSNTVHNQWGGRTAHPTWGLDQYLAQQGYVLLNVDISGSSGYGKAFRQRIAMDYGGVDVEDLFSAAQYLKGIGYVDADRMGIWGSSYGGLLTTTSLFTHPGTFKAGVAGAPATSLFHALTGEMRTMMAPQDHPAEYARASAFLKSGGLQDHLLFIHGMRDQIVLFKDSVTLLERLIRQGKDAQILVLPDAPHSWDTGPMSQTRYAYRHLVDYFKLYLGEGPSASRQAGTPSR